MLHLSRVTLAAIAFYLTHTTLGPAETRPGVHVHQRMGSNDETQAGSAISGDAVNARVESSCASVAASDKVETNKDNCNKGPDKASPVQTVSEDTRKRVKRAEDIPKAYLVSTVNGINQAQYEEFAKKPPLGDKHGDIIAFEGVGWVSCQYLDLTDAEAAIVRQDPIIAWAHPITEDAGEALVIPQHGETNSLQSRAT
jgi:hypothetical protein